MFFTVPMESPKPFGMNDIVFQVLYSKEEQELRLIRTQIREVLTRYAQLFHDGNDELQQLLNEKHDREQECELLGQCPQKDEEVVTLGAHVCLELNGYAAVKTAIESLFLRQKAVKDAIRKAEARFRKEGEVAQWN